MIDSQFFRSRRREEAETSSTQKLQDTCRLLPAFAQTAFVAALILVGTGCQTLDPASRFVAEMDQAPAKDRPKDWDNTKRLMARPVPAIGQPAPDFTLPSRDGSQTLTRSVHQAGKPLVLIFGSFT